VAMVKYHSGKLERLKHGSFLGNPKLYLSNALTKILCSSLEGWTALWKLEPHRQANCCLLSLLISRTAIKCSGILLHKKFLPPVEPMVNLNYGTILFPSRISPVIALMKYTNIDVEWNPFNWFQQIWATNRNFVNR
jgi:hypothetical protein